MSLKPRMFASIGRVVEKSIRGKGQGAAGRWQLTADRRQIAETRGYGDTETRRPGERGKRESGETDGRSCP